MRLLIALLFFLSSTLSFSQSNPLAAGPMIGHVDAHTAIIWILGEDYVSKAELKYWDKSKPNKERIINLDFPFELDPKVGRFELLGLDPSTEYEYSLKINDKNVSLPITPATFKTPPEPGKKNEISDLTFMVGSCMNNPSPILTKMAKTPADFMIWGGDNLYFSTSECQSAEGMKRRYKTTRGLPEMRELLAVRPNFATWDDHDFGPNDSGQNFKMKSHSLNFFKLFWANKTYGEPDNPGVYSSFQWQDVDFFLTDDRYNRSSDIKQDITYGKPNPLRKFFGDKQLKWLKNNLKESKATFKIVVCGSQVLNKYGAKESFRQYSYEFNDLIKFITDNKIEGVMFISGDKHFAELTFYQPKGGYKLFDFTCSALTSPVHSIKTEKEKNNPQRVPGTLLLENNFGLVTVTGSDGNRSIIIKTLDLNGNVKWQQTINENNLKF